MQNSYIILDPSKKLTLSMGDHTLSLQSSQIVNSGDLILTVTSGTLALSNSQDIPTLETGIAIENKGSGSVTLLGSTQVNSASNKATLLNSGSGAITLSNEATITNALGPALESKEGTINLTEMAVLKTEEDRCSAIACSGGTFNMTGGTVSGDSPQVSCDGVSMSKTAKFEMHGGSISVSSGSGVTLTDTADLTMTAGTIQTQNSTGSNFAVRNESQSAFNFSGSIVKSSGINSVCLSPPTSYRISPTSTDNWFSLIRI